LTLRFKAQTTTSRSGAVRFATGLTLWNFLFLHGINTRPIYQEGESMRVLESRVEPAGPGRIRVVTTLALGDEEHGDGIGDGLGDGPTGEAVPDRIVLALIANDAASMSVSKIQRLVGGNPATVNRQCWTLANNAPDLQHRLRGWVVSLERGRYALSAAALRRLEDLETKAFWLGLAGRQGRSGGGRATAQPY
jgi:hypothetical protein